MKQLKARLYEAELQKREAEADAANAAKTDIGWGHQIRSYVLQPYQLVKDLRTGVTSTSPERRARRRPRPLHGRGPVAARDRRDGRGRGCRVGRAPLVAVVLALAACRAQPSEPRFPEAHRDVAPIVGDTFSTEDARDRLGEAEEVMQLAGVKPGMSVADVGAGEGYYTVRLAPRRRARRAGCWPRTSCPTSAIALSDRVQREKLDNVAVKLGTPDNPMLPGAVVRPRVPGPHVSRGAVALRLPVAPARRGEARRAGRRRRFQPAGQAARNPAGAAQMRVRGARHGPGQVPAC